jgi:hypothetical protein
MSTPPILGGCVISRPARILSKKQGFTLISDLHVGAANVDYKLLDSELEEAKKQGDRILINGDVFDLILPQDHKRFTPDVLHPRLQGTKDVMNAAIRWGEEILAPCADQIDMIGLGNHETSVEKYHSFDPISALIHGLNHHRKNKGHMIHYGGYTGFVDYRFGSGGGNGHTNRRFVVWYHHGVGGSVSASRGMIDLSKTGWVNNVDLIWMGHKHVRVASHVQALSCPLVGDEPTIREVKQVITGAYFDTYCGQSQESIRTNGRRGSWAAEKCFPPQGKGGARVVVEILKETDNRSCLSIKVTQ